MLGFYVQKEQKIFCNLQLNDEGFPMDNRPNIVRRFYILYLTTLILGAINFILTYDEMLMEASPLMIGFIFLMNFGITFWLTISVSKYGSKKAKWILVTLWGIGIIFYVPQLSDIFQNDLIVGVISTLQAVIQSVAIYSLFTKEFKDWLDTMSTSKKLKSI
jgi:hypothetical protein